MEAVLVQELQGYWILVNSLQHARSDNVREFIIKMNIEYRC